MIYMIILLILGVLTTISSILAIRHRIREKCICELDIILQRLGSLPPANLHRK